MSRWPDSGVFLHLNALMTQIVSVIPCSGFEKRLPRAKQSCALHHAQCRGNLCV